jgi:hypothetical protein
MGLELKHLGNWVVNLVVAGISALGLLVAAGINAGWWGSRGSDIDAAVAELKKQIETRDHRIEELTRKAHDAAAELTRSNGELEKVKRRNEELEKNLRQLTNKSPVDPVPPPARGAPPIIGVLTTTLPPGSTQDVAAAANPVPVEPQPIQAASGGFIFQLRTCRWSGAKVTCGIAIQNELANRILRILVGGASTASRAHGMDGQVFRSDHLRVGNNAAIGGLMPAIDVRLRASEQVTGEIRFTDVPERVQRFTSVDLACPSGTGGRGGFRVEFSNVTIVH